MTRKLADTTQTWMVHITTSQSLAELAANLAKLGDVHALRIISRPDNYNAIQRERVMKVLVPLLRESPDMPPNRLIEALCSAGLRTKFGAPFTVQSLKYYRESVIELLREEKHHDVSQGG
jgi:hypothetical protein